MPHAISLNPVASLLMKTSRLLVRPSFIACFLLFLFLSPKLWAQVGGNNPTGVSGMFNGNVTTGCSYDPYTANATRTVTDMVVAGAVGDYGLSYARTWNSRIPGDWLNPGGWQHPYKWRLEADDNLAQPQSYTVSFPDGRVESFTPSGADIYFRAAPGVRERLIQWTSTNGTTGYAYLVLPDGGKVEFSGTRTYEYDPELPPPYNYTYYFGFTATALIDPHGRRTTFTYNPDGSLFQITEPAGRWIKVYYTAAGQVDYIKGSDNREVHYTYQTQTFPPGTFPYTVLTNVGYYGDGSLTSTYTYQVPNVGSPNGVPLLATCDDPMYAGPMKKISYSFATANNLDGTPAVYGQILSEKSGTTGEIVSTLTIKSAAKRIETRPDGKQRTFIYTGGYLTSWTDFKGISFSQTYDSAMYVASVSDGKTNVTNFTNNPLTGTVTQIQYPSTPGDTPPGTPPGTVSFNYGGTGCLDANNQDSNNPYYLCSVTDETGNVTQITRDSSKQITRIDYPDTGYETFGYDYVSYFGRLMTHRMKTGGLESLTYDTRGLRQTYRSPDNASGNPTTRYQYDALDRVSGVTDVFGSYLGEPYRTTNYEYNIRGQLTVTTLPTNPVDGIRHTIVNTYNLNGDGTLTAVTDQFNHMTTYSYDDYRRLRSMTTPLRFPGDSIPHTTYYSYDRNQGTGDDYTHTDSNVTLLTLPSTNIVKTTYDENYRKKSVTASAASGIDAATTSYGYDNAGNVESMLLPDEQPGQSNYGKSTTWIYDERNRLRSVTDPLNHVTAFTYDAGGRKKTVTQANGQVTTFDGYDSLNRLSQQTVKQTAQMDAVTKYTYEPGTGLHMTMQDPHLVAIGSNYVYAYEYDQMGRKTSVTYPPDYMGANRTELYTYDTAGRLGTYTNRDGKVQTFSYDNLHRQTGFTWSAGSGAPNLTLGYDAANRATSITNANAAISRTYFDDNLLKTETETPSGGTANTVTYAWNADAQRESIAYPSTRKYGYNYTGRDQLKQVQENNPTFNYQAEYVYDVNGNMATRKVGVNVSSFSVTTDASVRDALGRCTHLAHQLTGTTRTFDYVYDPMGNRTSIQRESGTAEAYGNDLAQQVTTGVDGGNAHTYGYDTNGNRTSLDGGGSYVTNFLNQQTTFNGQTVSYNNVNGNVNSVGSAASYIYDAQNRLTSVSNNGTTTTFNYDGLNRKISQTVSGVTTYNVWDGWNLIEERGSGNTLLNSYVYGAGEIIERITGTTSTFYFQDGLGSTSHVGNAAGGLLETYKYSTFGQVTVYDSQGNIRKNGSTNDIRHLYTGQLWMPQAGLYDYRNRVYSPTLTCFLQPDPIGFRGDRSNLYRYCGNNAVNWSDPSGMLTRHENNTQGHQIKPNEPMLPPGWYAQDPTGRIYKPDESNFGPDSTGTTDRVIAEIPGGNVGPWGEHDPSPGDFSPNDHGSGSGPGGAGAPDASAGGVRGGRPGGVPGGVPSGRPGVIPNPYLDSAPFIAKIGQGFDGPNLRQLANGFEQGATYYVAGVGLVAAGPSIYAGSVIVANASFDALLYAGSAGYIGYQTALANPQYIVRTQQFFQGFTPGMGGATSSYYGVAGWWSRRIYEQSQGR